MTKSPEDKPAKTLARSDRSVREAAALRANLLKRKDQARQREEAQKKPTQDRQSSSRVKEIATGGVAREPR